ncbi:AraC family transcriptional regulator [Sulfuricurvum sp.]|uniref:AraC family transcriptional regulator n=1 Tax=Sulfuricurvum sp. TaxID=2025608 RepID=UPI003BB79F76
MNIHLNKALRYIEHDLNDTLNVEALAQKAGYSKFHFSRIFKNRFGESVMEYAKRLRIEKSALHILRPSSLAGSVYEAGYETSAGFYKAFKKRFGMTPFEYKTKKTAFWKDFLPRLKNQPKIVYVEKKKVVFKRAVGEYDKSIDQAWESLFGQIHQLSQKYHGKTDIRLTLENTEFFGICHDDPSVTEACRIRYDACIASGENEIRFLVDNGFEIKTIPSGKYAMVVHNEDGGDGLEGWFGLAGWIIENGYTFGSEASFEKYIQIVPSAEECVFDSELYISLE